MIYNYNYLDFLPHQTLFGPSAFVLPPQIALHNFSPYMSPWGLMGKQVLCETLKCIRFDVGPRI